MKEQKLPEGEINGGSTGTPTPMTKTTPIAWYQDKRFLLGAFTFIVIVWLAATFLA